LLSGDSKRTSLYDWTHSFQSLVFFSFRETCFYSSDSETGFKLSILEFFHSVTADLASSTLIPNIGRISGFEFRICSIFINSAGEYLGSGFFSKSFKGAHVAKSFLIIESFSLVA
jgi:hypothetical protein